MKVTRQATHGVTGHLSAAAYYRVGDLERVMEPTSNTRQSVLSQLRQHLLLRFARVLLGRYLWKGPCGAVSKTPSLWRPLSATVDEYRLRLTDYNSPFLGQVRLHQASRTD